MTLRHAILIGFLLAPSAFVWADPASQPATQSQADYDKWIHAYRDTQGKSKLVITLVDVRPGEESPGEFASYHHYRVAMDGHTWSESFTSMGVHGGDGARNVSPEGLKRLDALLEKLPPDSSSLPPAERRLTLQFTLNNREAFRVYDRANLSDDTLDLLRVAGPIVGSWGPTFAPSDRANAGRLEITGHMSLSPDGKLLITALDQQPFQRWDPATHKLLGEIDYKAHCPDIAWSPDSAHAVFFTIDYCELVDTRTWKVLKKFAEKPLPTYTPCLYAPKFTPDGKYLIMQAGDGPTGQLRVFSATTWEPAERHAYIPADATAFWPAPSNKLALANLKDGSSILWNMDKRQKIAALDVGVRRWSVAFSPDESLCAVSYLTKENAAMGRGQRIAIFRTRDGHPEKQLLVHDAFDTDSIYALAWTPDGHYLLAATTTCLTIWNADSGRYRGSFYDAKTLGNALGLVLLPGGKEVATLISDGTLLYYDLPAALKQIRALEASFPPPATPPANTAPATDLPRR